MTAILDYPDATTDHRDRAQDLLAVCHEMAFEMAIIHSVTSVAMNHDDRQLCNMDARGLSPRALDIPRLQDEASVGLAAQVMKAWKQFL